MADDINLSVNGDDDPRGLATQDARLAGALLAMGFAPKGPPVRLVRADRPGDWLEWQFSGVSECGRWKAVELLEGWRGGASWVEKNPDHPFAYVMAAHKNHMWIVDKLRSGNKHHLLKSGKSLVLIGEEASLKTQDKLLSGGRGWV